MRDAFVDFVGVGQFAGQHQFQVIVLWVDLDGLARDFDGFIELLGVAIGVDLALIAAQSGVATHVDHFLICGDGVLSLVLLVVDGAEAFEEDAAIVLLVVGVGAVGVRGEVDHVLVDLNGFIVAAEDVEQQAFVVAGLEIVRLFLGGLADGRRCSHRRICPGGVPNFADVDQRAGVVRISVGQLGWYCFAAASSWSSLSRAWARAPMALRTSTGSISKRALIGGDGVLGALSS